MLAKYVSNNSLDGFFMNTAYGWAFARPVRRVFYNLTVTGMSVAVAFLIGGVEVAALLATQLHLHGWLGDILSEECEISWLYQADLTELLAAFPNLEHFRSRGGRDLGRFSTIHVVDEARSAIQAIRHL